MKKQSKSPSIRRTTKSAHHIAGSIETGVGKVKLSIETKLFPDDSNVPSAVEQAVRTTLDLLQASLQYCPHCGRFGGTHNPAGSKGKYPRCLRDVLDFSVEKMGKCAGLGAHHETHGV